MKGGENMIGLKFIRKLYGMTLDNVAELIGVSKQTVSKWERGLVSITSDNLKKLSSLFSLSPEYFFKELTKDDEIRIQQQKVRSELVMYPNQQEQGTFDLVECERREFEFFESIKDNFKKIEGETISKIKGKRFNMLNEYKRFERVMQDRRVDKLELRLIFTAVQIAYNNENIEEVENDFVKNIAIAIRVNRKERMQQLKERREARKNNND